MRVVNLSQRPFLNRRPVLRAATLLWIVGGLMLVTNLWLFAGYFSGTTKNRERLAELNAEIDAAELEFDRLGQRLSQVSLGTRNQRAAHLNELIDQRTFPWSRLFDELEDALSDDVYLTLVAPSVEAEEQRTTRTRSPSRRMTPREARERARQRRSAGGDGGGDSRSPASMPTPETANVVEESNYDVVSLNLQGVARSDDALLDFVDALYQNESFIDPDLTTEMREAQRGYVFNITTYYLLPRDVPVSQEGADDVADGSSAGADGGGNAAAPQTATATTPAGIGSGDGSGDGSGADDGSTRRRPDRTLRAGQNEAGQNEAGPGDAGRSGTGPHGAALATGDSPASGTTAGENDRETSPDPRVRRPGTSRDRRPLNDPRSRLDSLDESGRGRPEDVRQDQTDDPELTEPDASATPRLRRLGSLEPTPSPTDTADSAAPTEEAIS